MVCADCPLRTRSRRRLRRSAAAVGSDWASDDDLTWATARIATFSNYQAGQSRIAVQRVHVAESLYDNFKQHLLEQVTGLKVGDPSDEATQVGPAISAAAAERIDAWIADAIADGATILAGGGRERTMVEPTVLEGVPDDAAA